MSDRAYWCGVAGLIGALFVGIGEGLLQLQPGADYGDPNYAYLGAVSASRQVAGYWMSVLGAPLYVLGYWHLTRNLAPDKPRLRAGLFALMAYAFIIATVWIGQRIFIAEAVRSAPDMVARFSELNEPLVNVLRIAILVFSAAWIWLIASGQSRYPRWLALFSPAALLAVIFAIYLAAPSVGQWALPTAMNTAHFIVFALSLLTLRRVSKPA